MKGKLHYTALPYKKPRTVAAMRKFLAGHARYFTMNSWNRSSSYAVNIKLHSLRMTSEQLSACYDLLSCRDCHEYSGFDDVLRDFDMAHDYDWQIGTNGRSGGYAVLYRGGRRPSGYLSWCPECGQKNCKEATPNSCRCGKCGNNSRVNFDKPHTVIETYPGRGVDDDSPGVADNGSCEIRDRFKLVWDFDVAVEKAVAAFVAAPR